jgi:hypothetical protein
MYALAVLLTIVFVDPAKGYQERSAIVQIGGCSGVCVDPSGLIMTAKHCDLDEVETVKIGEQEFTALRIYEAPETEGPLIYDILGDGFAWVPVAQTKPESGEPVRSMGFPEINGIRQFREASGVVSGGTRARFRGEEFLGNTTDMDLTEGWSGGPLLNAQGEVVGLANSSGRGTGSIFISHAATREAFRAAQLLHASRPSLQIFVAPEEPRCRDFLQDFAGDLEFQRELREHFQLQFVDVRQVSLLHGRIPHGEFPVFSLANAASIDGYRNQVDLVKRLLELSRLNSEHLLREW